jgi:hypothetical protein
MAAFDPFLPLGPALRPIAITGPRCDAWRMKAGRLAVWAAALCVAGCGPYQPTPALLRDTGKQVGSTWAICDGQAVEEAVHRELLVSRLTSRFPVGTPDDKVHQSLASEGFQLDRCDENPAIHLAGYRWGGGWNWHGITYGGVGTIAYKTDQSGRLLWITGFVNYGSPV